MIIIVNSPFYILSALKENNKRICIVLLYGMSTNVTQIDLVADPKLAAGGIMCISGRD